MSVSQQEQANRNRMKHAIVTSDLISITVEFINYVVKIGISLLLLPWHIQFFINFLLTDLFAVVLHHSHWRFSKIY